MTPKQKRRFYGLTVISALIALVIRFATVNAVVLPGLTRNVQRQVQAPGKTDGVYDGVLMKMTDISYTNLTPDVGETLGHLKSLPSAITNEIETVNQLDWHLSVRDANQKFFSDLNGWKIIDVKDAESIYGFYAIAFKKGNTVVIAYRGTDDLQDVVSDTGIYLQVPGEVEQLSLAKQFEKDVVSVLPVGSYHLIFTGHSIGGWMSQEMYLFAKQTKSPLWSSVDATVFNSIGTEFQASPQAMSKVKDYHMQGDYFSDFGTSLGQEIEVPNPNLTEGIYARHQMFNFYGYFYPLKL